MSEDLSLMVLERSNSYIGQGGPHTGAKRLLEDCGSCTDDIALRCMVHIAFWRNPLAHAKIGAIDAEAAQTAPGAICVVTGTELSELSDNNALRTYWRVFISEKSRLIVRIERNND